MIFSRFGEKFTQHSGIAQLMEDLGGLGVNGQPLLKLGGGAPAHIPAIETRLRANMEAIMRNPEAFERIVTQYDAPAGERAFICALVDLLRREYGWAITPEHIVLTNGSQTAFFCLFNLLAGEFTNGQKKQILLPLAPEYMGYSDVGISEDLLKSYRPSIEILEPPYFKYHIDFNQLKIDDNIAAICVSRPTNPTGNVLTDTEIAQLSALAKKHHIPLIIDAAYGTPFPHITFTDATPIWEEHIILCLSLSKLGLPGLRTGIIIAQPEIVQAISRLNAIISLAPNTMGAALAMQWVQSGEILNLGKNIIKPYYEQRAMQAVHWFKHYLADIPFHLHKPEGAFFLWLWLPATPIRNQTLYQRLKQRGVLVVSGEYFFTGLTSDWQHRYECLRISYAQAETQVHQGIQLIADEIKQAYRSVI